MLLEFALATQFSTYITGRECGVLEAVLDHESITSLGDGGAPIELWGSPDVRVVYDGTYWGCRLPAHVRFDTHQDPEPDQQLFRIQALLPAMGQDAAALTLVVRSNCSIIPGHRFEGWRTYLLRRDGDGWAVEQVGSATITDFSEDAAECRPQEVLSEP